MKISIAAATKMEPEESLPLTLYRPTPTHSRPTTPVPHPLSNATPSVLPPPPEYVLQEYTVPLRPSAPSPDFAPSISDNSTQQQFSNTELSQQLKDLSQQNRDISIQIQSVQRDLNRLRNRHEHTLERVYTAIDKIKQTNCAVHATFGVKLVALICIGSLLVYYGLKEDWFDRRSYRSWSG